MFFDSSCIENLAILDLKRLISFRGRFLFAVSKTAKTKLILRFDVKSSMNSS